MATKSKLETVFTGDDRPFNRVASRIRKTAQKLKQQFSGMRGAIMGMGAGMAMRGALKKFDRFDKLSKQFKVSSETLQRFALVAELGGADIESLASAMSKLNMSLHEAASGQAAYQREFENLGLDAKTMQLMSHEEQIATMADAIKNASNRNMAMAASQKIMGRSSGKLFSIFEQGGAALTQTMASVSVVTNENTKAIAELNDVLTKLSTGGMAKLGTAIGTIFGWVEKATAWLALQSGEFDDMAIIKKLNREGVEAFMPKDKEVVPSWDPDAGEDVYANIAEKMAKDVLKTATGTTERNIFDPTRGGGFFAQATGRGIPLSKHATKSLDQKMKDLAQKTFQENQTTNQLLRDALL